MWKIILLGFAGLLLLGYVSTTIAPHENSPSKNASKPDDSWFGMNADEQRDFRAMSDTQHLDEADRLMATKPEPTYDQIERASAHVGEYFRLHPGSRNPKAKRLSERTADYVIKLYQEGKTSQATAGEQQRLVDSPVAQTRAFAKCQIAIEHALKAPSTAEIDEYGFGVDPMKGHIAALDSSTFRTYHQVDAENAFGAKLRKEMTCDIRCTTVDSCTVLAVNEN